MRYISRPLVDNILMPLKRLKSISGMDIIRGMTTSSVQKSQTRSLPVSIRIVVIHNGQSAKTKQLRQELCTSGGDITILKIDVIMPYLRGQYGEKKLIYLVLLQNFVRSWIHSIESHWSHAMCSDLVAHRNAWLSNCTPSLGPRSITSATGVST